MDERQFDELMRAAGVVPSVRATTMAQLAQVIQERSAKVRRRKLVVLAIAISGVLVAAAVVSGISAGAGPTL